MTFFKLKAIGIVFLYDRNEGGPETISKKFSNHFSSVSENLVSEKLLGLTDLKKIMDHQRIYFGGIRDRFSEIMEDESAFGRVAWKIFHDNSGIEPSEDVKSLIFEGKDAPWEFSLIVNVIYK